MSVLVYRNTHVHDVKLASLRSCLRKTGLTTVVNLQVHRPLQPVRPVSFDLRMRLGAESSRGSDARRDQEVSAQQPRSSQQPHVLDVPRRQGARQDGVPTLEGIIQQLLNGIITPTAMQNIGVGPWGVLHSNPMDYAWGANGLDAIITQLLSQLDNHGPPPADRETIDNLPTISVTAEHVDAGLECPVCKEDYKADESVRQLPCEHLFHNDCIVPWLEQHDTCPVCRESLTGQNSTQDSADRDFSSSSSSSSSTSASSNASSPSDENSAGNS
ncbi:E3 ubiquitin-protein ligase RNF126-B-like isoform X1 [Nelusetta ayraudi]|uniref:E3 ubiquitin-protein ligase RNF126-B-like isoform X1 n=1 Tax=Nelusetta ayraudi TaxID=303726 RepID=UPI003F7121DA